MNKSVYNDIAEYSKKLYYTYKLTFPYLLITVICVLLGSGYIAYKSAHWYDEFFTLYIAQLPSLSAILDAFLDGASNNTPFDFMIRHLFIQIAGSSALSLRFPSLAMFIVSGLFLYRYVSFRIPSLPATVAFCFPVLTLALFSSYEARYYSLLLASSAMSLYFWQQCVHKNYKTTYLFLLLLSLSFGCYIHLYGVMTFVPITLGEILRLYNAKIKVYRVLITILFSAASTVFLLPFVMHSAQQYQGHYFATARIGGLFSVYNLLLPEFGFAAAAVLIVVAPLIIYWQKKGVAKENTDDRDIPIHELVAAVIFCLIPIMVWIAAKTVTNAFWSTYCIASISGFSVLAAYMCNVIGKRHNLTGIIIVTCIMLVGLYTIGKRVYTFQYNEPRIAAKMVEFIESSELPIVVSHGHQYLYFDHYLPQDIRSKVSFLLDRDLSIKYLGEDTDNMSLIDLNKVRRFYLKPWERFSKQNKEFYVLSRHLNDGWPMRKIREDLLHDKLKLDLIYFSDKAAVVKVRYK
jgi:hypothetical protein